MIIYVEKLTYFIMTHKYWQIPLNIPCFEFINTFINTLLDLWIHSDHSA